VRTPSLPSEGLPRIKNSRPKERSESSECFEQSEQKYSGQTIAGSGLKKFLGLKPKLFAGIVGQLQPVPKTLDDLNGQADGSKKFL